MKVVTLLAILLCLVGSEAHTQVGRLALSPLQIITQNVGKTQIKMTYSRPAMRDRKIFGELVPYDELWRTGANRNSKIQFSHPVKIGDKKVEKGSYVIITKPSLENWDVYFYSDTTNWEVPEPWVDSLVVAHLNLPSETNNALTTSMTFSFDDITYDSCNLSLAWERNRISIPILCFTEEQMLSKIARVLDGPRASDYNAAASYRLQTGKELHQGIEWIEKAIGRQKTPFYYDFFVKAKLLDKLGKVNEANESLKTSLELAESSGNKYGAELVRHYMSTTNR